MEKLEKRLLSGEPISSEKPLIVAGIPAHNEEKTIARVILEAQEHADIVLVCDDGSSDLTFKIAEKLGAVVVKHRYNMGYGAAIRSLFENARKLGAGVLVTLDADGQHAAVEIQQILQPILEGKADVAIGSRFLDGSEEGSSNGLPWYRQIGIKLITKLTASAIKYDVSDAQNGFRAYNVTAMEKLDLNENGMGVSVEILVKAKEQGLRLVEVPINCKYHGVEETSSQNLIGHGASVLSSLVKLVVEKRPLVFLGLPGILFLGIGVFFGVWMLQIYAIEHRIVTNIALASLAFVLMGFFALSTAIMLYAIVRLAEKTNSKSEG